MIFIFYGYIFLLSILYYHINFMHEIIAEVFATKYKDKRILTEMINLRRTARTMNLLHNIRVCDMRWVTTDHLTSTIIAAACCNPSAIYCHFGWNFSTSFDLHHERDEFNFKWIEKHFTQFAILYAIDCVVVSRQCPSCLCNKWATRKSISCMWWLNALRACGTIESQHTLVFVYVYGQVIDRKPLNIHTERITSMPIGYWYCKRDDDDINDDIQ